MMASPRGAVALLAAGAVAVAIGARARSQPSGAAPPSPADEAIGFDHIFHEGRVTASAATPPPCSRCHAIDAGGKLGAAPGHAACFGDCHGAPPPRAGKAIPPEPEREAVCRACHRPSEVGRLSRAGARRPARPAPPRAGAIDGEFAIAFSHAAHSGTPRGCRTCHAVPPEPRAAAPARRGSGHPRCASCHTGSAGAPFSMATCSSCHTAAVGPLRAPHTVAGRFPVAATFSHQSHVRRVRGAGDPCAACHAGAAAATTDLIPAPDKPACATCHDGRVAFSMTEAACRRCHAAPSTAAARGEERRERRELRRAAFSHASHAQTDCRSCHGLAKDGEPGPVGSGHEPCANSGCHAPDFGAAEPTICTTCHVRGEPWRDLHLDPQPTGPSDFEVAFSHRAHLGGASPRTDAACARCHVAEQDGSFAPGAGHASCGGTTCHAVAGATAPALGDCAACHERAGTGRQRLRAARSWSVRDRFTHAGHLVEPGDPARAVACTDCHGGVLEAGSVDAIRPPPKKACARCHDGGAAFKLTGHGCARCHTPARRSERPQTPRVERPGQRDRGQRPAAQQPQ